MKLYLQFILNSIRSNLTYRVNTFFKLVSEIMALFVFVFIWASLFRGSPADSLEGAISLHEMISYTVISIGIKILTSASMIDIMNDRIRTGQIALDFIKPFSIKLNLLCSAAGEMISSLIVRFVPVFIIAMIVYKVYVPPAAVFLPFLTAVILGYFLYMEITYFISLSGFWYIEMWHLRRFVQDIIRIFSGAWVPIWFFPKFLYKLSIFLPFRLIYYFPISIYLGKLGKNEIISMLIQQIVWILGFSIAGRVVWKFAKKKLVIQGG